MSRLSGEALWQSKEEAARARITSVESRIARWEYDIEFARTPSSYERARKALDTATVALQQAQQNLERVLEENAAARKLRDEQEAARAARAEEEARRAAERAANREEDRFVIVDSLYAVLNAAIALNKSGRMTPRKRNMYGRILGNRITHELPGQYTGECSISAIKEGYQAWTQGRSYTATLEHYNPSQVMGLRMLDHFLRKGYIEGDATTIDSELQAIINEATKVRKVTAHVNNILRDEQKSDVFVDGDTAYANLNIETRPWPLHTPWSAAMTMYPDLFEE